MNAPSPQSASLPSERDTLLRAAMRSPELAAEHDKQGWLALYSDDAVVEDPVGTPASHKGRRRGRLGDELGRFYEAFIAPSGIRMSTRQDVVSDRYVFRAVDIHTTNLSTGLEMKVPANLLYEIIPADRGLAIRRMQAHWELSRMSRMLMSKGSLGFRTIAVMNWSMLRAFGPKWLMAYFKASQKGVGRSGKELVGRLASEVGHHGSSAFSSDAIVELPGGIKVSAPAFLEGCSSLEVRDLLASGETVSGLASLDWGGRKREAALVAELDEAGTRVHRFRLFWEG